MQNPLSAGRKSELLEAFPKASAILLVAMLAMIFLSAMSVLAVRLADIDLPKVENGDLKISRVESLDLHSIPLNGQWRFYWQQLLAPKEAFLNSRSAKLIDVPHSWDRVQVEGESLHSHGFATYQMSIFGLPNGQPFALVVPEIGTAFRLYINEELVSSGGEVSDSKELAAPYYSPDIVSFTAKNSVTKLTLQVSNYHLYWAGIWQPLRIATPEVAYKEQLNNAIRASVIMSILVTVAVFNLIHFTLRPQDPLPFIIAISCLLLGLRELEDSQLLTVADIWSLPWETYVRLNFLTFYLTAPIIASYFHFSFVKDFHMWMMKAIYIVSGVFALLVLVTEPVWFSHTMIWYQIFAIVMMFYILWRLMVVVKRKRNGARLLMIGTLCLFSLVLNDILYNLQLVNTGLLVAFGLVAFVICQSYLTYIRFINATEENVILYETLEKRNQELESFSHTLEEQVQHRTDELQQANLKLEELANQDTLTGIANRRGILPYIAQSIKGFQKAGTAFSLLVVDFDRFKQLNDALGHEIGDVVLSSGAKVMKSELRASDKIARWGGEEFLVLLPGTAIEGAEVLAEKLRVAIKEKLSREIKRQVTVTIGICEYRQDESFEKMFKRADVALYEGKELGRDRVVLAR